jgi:antitoxin component YwqK of YwqJK toxin-antitoxin module
MATVNKNFRIKNGLVVEGSTGTINGQNILTETGSDQYILDLVGGANLIDSVNSTQLEIVSGELSVKANVFDTYGAASSAQSAAESYADGLASNYDPAGAASTAESNAKSYADGLASNYDAAGSASTAESNAKSYADGLASNYDPAGAASTAESNAKSYADGLASNYDPAGAASTAESNAKSYADGLASNYDPAGAAVLEAGYVAQDLSDHIADTSTHGVSGDIVGTSDVQTLTNKTINDELHFTNPSTQNYDGGIKINDSSEDFEITAYSANLHLTAHDDVTITSQNGGDIVLEAANKAYVGSVSAGNEIATNSYVDNAVSGLDWKNAVHVKIDSNISNLSDAAGTYDGHTLTTADAGLRVLLVGQTTGSENGIYVISENAGDVVLTRSADADAYTELLGAAVYVAEGTQYGGTSWVQSNAYLTNFSGQNWTQFSGQGSVTAGDGITVDGLEVSIDRTTVDTWYDAAGEAGIVAGDLSDHIADTSTHGVTGNIVGTSDTQTLSNKSFSDAIKVSGNVQISSTSQIYLSDSGAGTPGSGTLAIKRSTDSGKIAINANGSDDNIATETYAAGAASTAESNAKSYADGLASNYDAAGAASQALTDANDYTDGYVGAVLDGSEPFTAINVNSVSLQKAVQSLIATAQNGSSMLSWAKSNYGSAKAWVKFATATHSQISEILLTTDSSNNIAITDFAEVGTNGSLGTITASYLAGNIAIEVNTVYANTTVTVVATLIK